MPARKNRGEHAVHVHCTIRPDQAAWLEANQMYSPSGILRDALDKLMAEGRGGPRLQP